MNYLYDFLIGVGSTYALWIFCFAVMTVLLLEIPQETTVTSGLSRQLNDCDCWRKSLAAWAAPLLRFRVELIEAQVKAIKGEKS